MIGQGESIEYVSKQVGHASVNVRRQTSVGTLFKEISLSAMNRISMRIVCVC
jgi:hypothetical protein